MDGKRVMFTPKFLSVNLRVFLIASRRAAGFGCVNAVRIPRPPAFETAATSSGTPTLDPVRVVRYRDKSDYASEQCASTVAR